MQRALATVALVALAIGCRPSLNDGQYSCPDDVCPSPLVCWASDSFCHYGPDPGVANDGGGSSPDTATMCTATTVGNCPDMQFCVVGSFGTDGRPSLQCIGGEAIRTSNHGGMCTMGNTHDCASPDACITVPGGTSWCMRPCGPAGAPCGLGEDCITPAGVTGAMPRVCAPRCDRACGSFPTGTQLTCSTSGYCLPPDW